VQNINPWSAIITLLAIVCFVRRKQAIGGWLLWFLSQLLLGAASVLVSAAMSWRNYLPSAWTDPPQHLFYGLSRPPQALAIGIVACCACEAARAQTEASLRGLQTALAASTAIAIAVAIVDTVWFSSLLGYDLRLAGTMAVVLLYLWFSRRVKRVFVKHNWTGTMADNPNVATVVPKSDD